MIEPRLESFYKFILKHEHIPMYRIDGLDTIIIAYDPWFDRHNYDIDEIFNRCYSIWIRLIQ